VLSGKEEEEHLPEFVVNVVYLKLLEARQMKIPYQKKIKKLYCLISLSCLVAIIHNLKPPFKT